MTFNALASPALGKSGCSLCATSSRTCLGKTIWPFSTKANNLLPLSYCSSTPTLTLMSISALESFTPIFSSFVIPAELPPIH